MSAVVHNLPELAAPLKQSIEESVSGLNFDFKSLCLIPPKSVFPDSHGICIFISKSAIELAPQLNSRGRRASDIVGLGASGNRNGVRVFKYKGR